MCFGASKASVNLEANGAERWLFVCFITQIMAYIYTVHVVNLDISNISLAFAGILAIATWISFHRIARAKDKLHIEEGEGEWQCAVINFAITLALFAGSMVLARTNTGIFDGTLHDDKNASSADRHRAEGHETATVVFVHLLYILSVVFNFVTYVSLGRLIRVADDTFANA